MPQPDLTPFGFTPTESLAYRALTELGPLTGYAVAQSLSIARANAYQALRGLVAKGAVTRTADRPERYRPLQPSALLALLAERQARKLDRLEVELSSAPAAGGPAILPIAGERALLDLTLRTAARAAGPVTCIGPARVLAALAPAWHKRVLDGSETSLWSVGEGQPGLPSGLTGQVDPDAFGRLFASPVLLLVSPAAAVVATLAEGGPVGWWTSDPVLGQVIRAIAILLTLTQQQQKQ